MVDGPNSVAAGLARMIVFRVPHWHRVELGPSSWRFTDPDEDYRGRYVEVHGDFRQQLTVPELVGKVVGPTLIAYNGSGSCLHVTLPHVTDATERLAAIEAAVAIDALPPYVQREAA